MKLMIQQTKPQIISLQETKLNDINGFLATEFLGPRYNTNFEY